MSNEVSYNCEIPVTKKSLEENFSTFVYCIAKEIEKSSTAKPKFFTLRKISERIKKIDPEFSKEEELEKLMKKWMECNIIFDAIGGYRFFH